ncbi:MAG: chemotaxis protein CheW [Planctomycetota bacterium]
MAPLIPSYRPNCTMTIRANETQSSANPRHRADTSQFVAFELDQQTYAFPIEKIREIVILDHITPVPQVARHVDGVTNLRGQIIPIVHLRCLFDLPLRPFDDETRTIVVQVGERLIGCTVDSVSQVLRIAHADIQSAPESIATAGQNSIDGFAQVQRALSDGEQNEEPRLIVLLDVEALLHIDHLQEDVQVAASTRAAQLAQTSPNESRESST